MKLYSGLTNMEVMTVNPTLQQLHDLGINLKTEPNYFIELNGEEYFKVTFWLKNSDITTRFEILTQPKERTSQTGKFQWINNVGQATWSAEEPSYDWWKAEGQRKAYVGEETLVEFVKAWANVASGDDVSFETIGEIVKGNVTEIQTLAKVLDKNTIRVLVGVKDGKYQSVYTKHFGRVKPQRDNLFIKKLSDEYGTFNAEFNSDLIWGEFTPQLAVPTPDPDSNGIFTDTPSEGDDW